mmetsp:Transcript_16108/g.45584  ORF Transcript_16108/g.45584 Transcript_16108/m.45584 type:complete len:242 (+) Transcript_16108:837-1562(+)
MATVSKAADCVWVLRLDGSRGNPIGPKLLEDLNTSLDCLDKELDTSDGAALVIAAKSDDVFCSGLDIKWLMKQQVEQQLEFLDAVYATLHRLLVYPVPVVAAIRGHAIAGGWLLALCADYRVMDTGDGRAWMPEVDMGFPLTAPFMGLLKDKLDPRLAARMLLEGSRFSAGELAEFRAVDATAAPEDVEREAMALATRLAPKGTSPAFGQLKADLFAHAVAALASATDVQQDEPRATGARL